MYLCGAMRENTIHIQGARVNNLKDISLDIPRDKLVVITGVSGSGKSSLAFDTLYAEGQRRYVESLSSYARQFLCKISKPDVDSISGISPSIAIGQRVNTTNSRSTVGTVTEIYEYLKLFMSRLGKTYSPISNCEVKQHSVSDIVDVITSKSTGQKCYICYKIKTEKVTIGKQLQLLLEQGFSRIVLYEDNDIKITPIEDINNNPGLLAKIAAKGELLIMVDRYAIKMQGFSDEMKSRIADSVQTTLYEGDGHCFVITTDETNTTTTEEYSTNFEADGIIFERPEPNLFSFNNPYGACPECEGYGKIIGIDEDLVIPNKQLSVFQDAVVCWRGETMQLWKEDLIKNAEKSNFPIHKPIAQLTEKEYDMLWEGSPYFEGINDFFKYVKSKSYKIQYKVILSRFQGKTSCPVCKGKRLRKEACYVKFNGKTIIDFLDTPIKDLNVYFNDLLLDAEQMAVGGRILKEIRQRLGFLSSVGLNYLTLSRESSTLSGGEMQRINLSAALGSNLANSMYILDEPSVGLHSRDTMRLIETLKKLRDLGNTVIVVEHDEDIIRAADYIVDIGPLAGRLGGEVVFSGTIEQMLQADTLTAKYLRGELSVKPPLYKRKPRNFITVHDATQFNLKNITVKFPLNVITVVIGVSGSGKTTLVDGILYPALKNSCEKTNLKTGNFSHLSGDINSISSVELVDQNPIGRSSRSNPITYIEAFDDIRTLFAQQKLAVARGYKAGIFSFNVPGGRCEACEGDGYTTVEMQFLADVTLVCEECGGKRFKQEILEIKYNGYSIYDVLEMTINQAIEVFGAGNSVLEKRITEKLKPLQDVGLGYLKMGQSSTTLSGGEAQRVKLAYFLSKSETENPKLFIFDEPTTGLHFHDINNLMASFNALIEKGHSVIIIEHNKEVIKCADYIVELGPDGGEAGGYLISEG